MQSSNEAFLIMAAAGVTAAQPPEVQPNETLVSAVLVGILPRLFCCKLVV
jgi:hypothetical protein